MKNKIVVVVYQLDNKIVKLKDYFEKLEFRIKQLKKMGTNVLIFKEEQEEAVEALLIKHGGKRYNKEAK